MKLTNNDFKEGKLKNTARQIKPHKGGRNLTIRARLTEAEKEIVDTARKKLSYADYLVSKASKGVRTKTPKDWKPP